MPGGASVYSTQTVNSADLGDIYGRPGRGYTGDAAPEAAIEGSGSEVERGILLPSTLPRSPRPKVLEYGVFSVQSTSPSLYVFL